MTAPVTLRQRAQQYVAVRRALGYKLVDNEHLLMQFIDYLERCGATTLATSLAGAGLSAGTSTAPNPRVGAR
ncbi:hypothetical protein ABW17_08255 [Mycobacterium nebraskense]|uniref:hypothetical protein n=1 Tax=Mycobacterium nebraskense TaxID=244292 RepID=UPI000641DAB9|nr:hypothetical protein [Mycobacterium nebraskense]KLO44671.1 hypothetical protein ABW17_08255 [Mycobacterium nebraskense]